MSLPAVSARARALTSKLFGYMLTGGVAAIIDLAGFLLLLDAGLGLWPSAALSFTVAAVANFALSSRLVFASRIEGRLFPLFFAVALVGLTVNTGVTVAAGGLLGLPPPLAKLTGIGTSFLFNFGANARVVFGNSPSGEG